MYKPLTDLYLPQTPPTLFVFRQREVTPLSHASSTLYHRLTFLNPSIHRAPEAFVLHCTNKYNQLQCQLLPHPAQPLSHLSPGGTRRTPALISVSWYMPLLGLIPPLPTQIGVRITTQPIPTPPSQEETRVDGNQRPVRTPIRHHCTISTCFRPTCTLQPRLCPLHALYHINNNTTLPLNRHPTFPRTQIRLTGGAGGVGGARNEIQQYINITTVFRKTTLKSIFVHIPDVHITPSNLSTSIKP